MGVPERWDEILDALADPYRRELLVALLAENPQDDDDTDPLDLLASGEESDRLETQLLHVHLPKLEELGFVRWDRETNEVSKGPNWDEIAPVLELVQNHSDELPEGWL